MVQSFSDNKYIYSVDMMFSFLKNHKYPVTKVKVEQYLDSLDHPGWGDPEKEIAFSPNDVLKYPRKYKDDYQRILKADLSYPIIISNGYIIDGVHRLTKAYLQHRKFIKAYIFTPDLMKKFKIAKYNEWAKVLEMEIYEFLDLYEKRFCLKK